MTTIALYSNKGGVGKTAAAVNLSYLAAQAGFRTLIWDLDPQSSTTYYFRVKPKIKRKARGFTDWNEGIDRSIKGTDFDNLDLLPADFTHRNLDIIFYDLKRSKHRLTTILKPLENEYELILLDCLSTINILAENIFNASDHIIVPMIPTTLSIRTYRQLLSFLKGNEYRPERVFAFFSMVDWRKKMHRELIAEAPKYFKGILKSFIPYLSIIERMGIERQPLPAYAPKSTAALAYSRLWGEIEQKLLYSNLERFDG